MSRAIYSYKIEQSLENETSNTGYKKMDKLEQSNIFPINVCI